MPTNSPAGPPGGRPPADEKLGPRDALAFIVAALGLVGPYVAIAVGLFVVILLLARLLG